MAMTLLLRCHVTISKPGRNEINEYTGVFSFGFERDAMMGTVWKVWAIYRAGLKFEYSWVLMSVCLFVCSFAEYYNPENAEFGVLRVLNDDLVKVWLCEEWFWLWLTYVLEYGVSLIVMLWGDVHLLKFTLLVHLLHRTRTDCLLTSTHMIQMNSP